MRNYITRITLLLSMLFVAVGCENEPVGEGIALDPTAETIDPGSELFGLLQTMINQGDDPVENTVCIDIVYPCKVFVYDADSAVVNEVVLTGDIQFSGLLAQLPLTHSISLSYPLQTTLPDGTVFSVNNNTELRIALDSCSREDLISHCDGLFGNPQGTCVWEVPYIPGGNNEFAGAVFTADATGTITLYHHNTEHEGTWIFLYLNDELHLNISLNGIDATVIAWNHNFKVTTFTGDVFEFQTPTSSRKLVKDCADLTVYTIGQTGPSGGIIAYDKGSYSNGWRYIEASLTDSIIEEWGCMNGQVTHAQYDEIGTGYQNTVAIVNYHNNLTNYYLNPIICSNLNNGSVSAKTALDQVIGLKKDWFIPSVDELELLYTNLHQQGLGTFDSTNYWSSSEMSVSKAKSINFSSGQITNLDKNSPLIKTRLIRFF